jgi:rubrerythrin
VLAYGAIAERLTGSARAAAESFLAHERAHARAIERALGELDSRPAPPRPAGQYRSGFPRLRTEEDALRFALDVEDTQIAAYGESVASLFTPELRVTVATILATQAEHMAVVLGQLDEPQSPKAFLVGKPPGEE